MAAKKTIHYKIQLRLKFKFLWWPVKPVLNRFSTTQIWILGRLVKGQLVNGLLINGRLRLVKRRLVNRRLVNGQLINGRLLERTVRQRTIGQIPLQRRNKCETLWNILNCPLAKYLWIHGPPNVFLNRRRWIMFMRPSLRKIQWDYNVGPTILHTPKSKQTMRS